MEFRKLRRSNKVISDEAAKQLLKTEKRGVFAVNGDMGYPYAIPINYYYDELKNKIYFHGAKAGHKLDALKKDDRVCFTVYGNEQIKDAAWAPYMQSVVIFGRCRTITDFDEICAITRTFAAKYYPNTELVEAVMQESAKAVLIYEISIEHLCGKEIQER